MPTPKEILQKRAADAVNSYTKAGAEAERLHSLVKAERTAIAQLTSDHAAACKAIAIGQNADTAPILTEKARRSDRLTGLEALYGEATEKVQSLEVEHVQASRALEAEMDREQLETLQAAIVQAEEQRESAREALKSAEQAVSSAVYARDRFRKKVELKVKARA